MPKLPQRCLTVVDVAVFRAGGGGVSNSWLMYFLNSSSIRRKIELQASGSTRKRIARGKLGELLLPIPPLAEQIRIAETLDKLLAQVDTLKSRIETIPALLKRFRQSVLASAISGRLTEDWRAIKMTSRRNESPCGGYKNSALSDLINDMRNGLSAKPNEEGKGHPILRISAVRSGSVDQNEIRYLECDARETARSTLQVGDLLFTRYNGSLELVGVCGLIHHLEHPNLLYPDKLIRVRANSEKILPKYLEIYFSSPNMRNKVMELVKSTSGQKGISGQDLKNMNVCYPSINEQTEIVRRAEQLFAFADQLEAKVASAKSRIDHMTQSILAKAFRGELVPQDSNDEPASVLLERIRAERAAQPKMRRGRKSTATN